MNRQKLACLGFVLSIFGLLGSVHAQEPEARVDARATAALQRQITNPPALTLPRNAELSHLSQASTLQQTGIPPGTYSAIFPQTFTSGGQTFQAGEYFITLLMDGRMQWGSDDQTTHAGTYAITQDQIEINLPFERGACAAKATYRFQLQGNKLSFVPLTGTTDGCVARAVWLTTMPLLKKSEGAGLWQARGPEGGRVYALLAHDGKLFAAGDGGGIYVSNDSGLNWRLTSNAQGAVFRSLGAFQGNLFAGTSVGGIAVSTDGGQTWVNRATGPTNAAVYDFAEHGGKFYAATVNSGVWRMVENPYQWEKTGATGLENSSVYALASAGERLFAGTESGIFVSTDGGNNWTAASNGLTFGRIRTLAAGNGKLYAGTAFGTTTTNEVFVSENNGQLWQRLGNGLAADFSGTATNAIYDLLVQDGKVFGVGTSGVIVHDGTRWTTLHRSAPILGFFAITANANKELFAGSINEGIARSLDGGATWNTVNRGFNRRYSNDILKADGVLYLGVNDGIYTSHNEGQTWVRASGITNITYSLLAFDGKVYAGTSNGVYVSSDQGGSWVRTSNGLGAGSVLHLLAVGNVLYAAVLNSGVYKSTDRGSNWTPSNNGLTVLTARELAINGTTLYVATNSGLFRSADEGQTWVSVTGLPSLAVWAVAVSNGVILASVLSDTIYRSTNDGQTWAKPEGFQPTGAYPVYVSGNNVFTSSANGLTRSTDNGRTWRSINEGFAALYAEGKFVSGATLYAATYNSVYISHHWVNHNATVSAASYSAAAIADKTIVAAFGPTLATTTQAASGLPLPTTLAGTTVKVRDSNGVERAAPLFFVSGGQVNYQIPAGTAAGTAFVTITNGDGIGATGELNVLTAAPTIFTANASGTGAAAAVDAISGAAAPFNAKQANGEPNILAVFGTGLGADGTDVDGNVNTTVTASLGGQAATVLYAGRAPGFAGLNQFNVQLPATIAAGTHVLTLTRSGQVSNRVTITIR